MGQCTDQLGSKKSGQAGDNNKTIGPYTQWVQTGNSNNTCSGSSHNVQLGHWTDQKHVSLVN